MHFPAKWDDQAPKVIFQWISIKVSQGFGCLKMHLPHKLSYFPNFIVTFLSIRYCTGLESFYALLVIFPSQPQYLVWVIISMPTSPTSLRGRQKQGGLASRCSHCVQHRLRHGADNRWRVVCSMNGSSGGAGEVLAKGDVWDFLVWVLFLACLLPVELLPGSLHLLSLQICSVFSHLFKL